MVGWKSAFFVHIGLQHNHFPLLVDVNKDSGTFSISPWARQLFGPSQGGITIIIFEKIHVCKLYFGMIAFPKW